MLKVILFLLFTFFILNEIVYRDIIPKANDQVNFDSSLQREKRQSGKDEYTVQLLMVVDYTVYTWWYNLSTAENEAKREQETEDNLLQYYAFVFNGIDLRYRGIVDPNKSYSLAFAGLIIAKNSSLSPWNEEQRPSVAYNAFRETANASYVLQSFSAFINQTYYQLPEHDHAILFTGFNLVYGGTSLNKGLSFPESVCSWNAVSVVEDTYDSRTIGFASRELGRSLGSRWDTDGNTCRTTDYYIMTLRYRFTNARRAPNFWKFSSCSINYFRDFTDLLDRDSKNCLNYTNGDKYPPEITELLQQLPGQVYDADEQCRHVYGSNSFVCRERIDDDYASICRGLYCYDVYSGSCKKILPFDGTICGSNKICLTAICTNSSIGINVPDGCPFGDQPVLADVPYDSCEDWIYDRPFDCYETIPRSACCQTCDEISTDIPECKYGDRVGDCREDNCTIYSNKTRTYHCCLTCQNSISSFSASPVISSGYSSAITPTTTSETTNSDSHLSAEFSPSVLISSIVGTDSTQTDDSFTVENPSATLTTAQPGASSSDFHMSTELNQPVFISSTVETQSNPTDDSLTTANPSFAMTNAPLVEENTGTVTNPITNFEITKGDKYKTLRIEKSSLVTDGPVPPNTAQLTTGNTFSHEKSMSDETTTGTFPSYGLTSDTFPGIEKTYETSLRDYISTILVVSTKESNAVSELPTRTVDEDEVTFLTTDRKTTESTGSEKMESTESRTETTGSVTKNLISLTEFIRSQYQTTQSTKLTYPISKTYDYTTGISTLRSPKTWKKHPSHTATDFISVTRTPDSTRSDHTYHPMPSATQVTTRVPPILTTSSMASTNHITSSAKPTHITSSAKPTHITSSAKPTHHITSSAKPAHHMTNSAKPKTTTKRPCSSSGSSSSSSFSESSSSEESSDSSSSSESCEDEGETDVFSHKGSFDIYQYQKSLNELKQYYDRQRQMSKQRMKAIKRIKEKEKIHRQRIERLNNIRENIYNRLIKRTTYGRYRYSLNSVNRYTSNKKYRYR